ncbi:MAG TPA: hypothetical protein VJ508_02615 [Saprospiraceae bacterium]|nr:hypothetical protein [Saprospiraceae bacterium]
MFKKLKSLFVIEDGEPTPESKTSTETVTETRKEGTMPVFDVSKTSSSGKGQVQDKFLEVLFGALESNNQEGFDYMEFKDFLKSLANVPMDDSTRFKSAFATAQTMGATKEKILASAKQYMSILDREKAKFQDALEGQKQKNLTGKQDEIKELQSTITQNEADIEKLKSDIEAHKQQISSLQQEIAAASDKIAQTANDFDATYKALVSQIQTDVQNIESHL